MACIFLNLGSNLGDRRLNLSRAMRAIGEEFGNFEISHVVESAPWGYDSTHNFLNLGMVIESELPPLDILHKLQAIEKSISPSAHRTATGEYMDREIDIDIIAIDCDIIDLPELKVPHPKMCERKFVLEPLHELAPGWRHPVSGETPVEMLLKLER